ncbi:hypothetical protein [Lusitaniella coriacea]
MPSARADTVKGRGRNASEETSCSTIAQSGGRDAGTFSGISAVR